FPNDPTWKRLWGRPRSVRGVGTPVDAEGSPHGSELRVRLAPFGLRVRIRHDPGAGEEADAIALLELTAAQGDAELPVAAAVHPADRPRVPAAVHLLETTDEVHRPSPWRASHRGGGVHGVRDLERADP